MAAAAINLGDAPAGPLLAASARGHDCEAAQAHATGALHLPTISMTRAGGWLHGVTAEGAQVKFAKYRGQFHGASDRYISKWKSRLRAQDEAQSTSRATRANVGSLTPSRLVSERGADAPGPAGLRRVCWGKGDEGSSAADATMGRSRRLGPQGSMEQTAAARAGPTRAAEPRRPSGRDPQPSTAGAQDGVGQGRQRGDRKRSARAEVRGEQRRENAGIGLQEQLDHKCKLMISTSWRAALESNADQGELAKPEDACHLKDQTDSIGASIEGPPKVKVLPTARLAGRSPRTPSSKDCEGERAGETTAGPNKVDRKGGGAAGAVWNDCGDKATKPQGQIAQQTETARTPAEKEVEDIMKVLRDKISEHSEKMSRKKTNAAGPPEGRWRPPRPRRAAASWGAARAAGQHRARGAAPAALEVRAPDSAGGAAAFGGTFWRRPTTAGAPVGGVEPCGVPLRGSGRVRASLAERREKTDIGAPPTPGATLGLFDHCP
ncbi:unnamed protein product [Prorocentrum cordatum]|uniref:Uncharacterized protein n=1 Tax=Prorocentrum cordatum TaxID=2364126 RepID=A0ABN9TZZ1_9DINO|nr:unnamed protein product [Polarella glacialis]